MLSDESSSDSETGRFKCQTKSQDDKSNNTSSKRDSFHRRSGGRNRRSADRFNRDADRRRSEREHFERHSRDRNRYSRYSPRRRYSRDRSKISSERYRDRHRKDSRSREEKSKPRETRSISKEKHRHSRSRSHKTPIRNVRDEIKDIITKKDRNSDQIEKKTSNKDSLSPEPVIKKSVVHIPIETQKKKSESPIVIEEHEGSDVSEEVQPGSYYNMIPAIVKEKTEDVKEKSEESSEIDSSDDERLRAKLLNLEKELQKTKKKKHKKKHKRKNSKSDKDKRDSSASVEVTSTTDIPEVITESSTAIYVPEVTSTQKNQKETSEEGEILSDDSQSDIDPNDLRHKLKRSKTSQNDPKLDKCGPALPPHLERRFKKSTSPVTEGPSLPPHLQKKVHNLGPSIPEDLRKVLAENSEMAHEVINDSSEDDGIGPLPTGAEKKWSEAHQLLEERAIEIKIKTLDGYSVKNSNIKSREKWMLELPEGKAKYLGLEARSFRAKEGPDMSDRSSWTDTPEDKARKASGMPKEEDANTSLQREARERHIASRDDDQEKAAKKHKKKHKREESLLEMHQKKLKKKKKKGDKDEEKKERRPFSRDLDLQVNRFDEAQKKSIIKKAQGLNTRFSSGEAKYL